MKKISLITAAVLLLNINLTSAEIIGDAKKGKTLSATCAACHGIDGNSPNAQWPKLAGQHLNYIVKQLQDFKSGARENAIMNGMAATLSEQDMYDLASYYSSEAIKGGTTKADLVELGEKIYRAGDKEIGVPACMACHGPAGKGNPSAMYPALAGQHSAYIANQMLLFQTDKRANDKNTVMRTIAKLMTQEQIEAVSSYLQGLR